MNKSIKLVLYFLLFHSTSLCQLRFLKTNLFENYITYNSSYIIKKNGFIRENEYQCRYKHNEVNDSTLSLVIYYDNSGRIIEIDYMGTDGKTPNTITEFDYSDSNIVSIKINNGKTIINNVYVFASNDYLNYQLHSVVSATQPKDALENTAYKFEYDSVNNFAIVYRKYGNEKFRSYRKYHYYKDNDNYEEYDENNVKKYIYTYLSDSSQNKLTLFQEDLYGGNKILWQKYFNEAHQLTKFIFRSDIFLDNEGSYIYNPDGTIFQVISKSNTGKKYFHHYYFRNNNLIN